MVCRCVSQGTVTEASLLFCFSHKLHGCRSMGRARGNSIANETEIVRGVGKLSSGSRFRKPEV